MTPEDSQMLYDLRVQMCNNRKAGKPLTDGMDEATVRRFFAMMKQGRGAVGGVASSKKKKAKETAEAAAKPLPDSLKDFCDLDLG